MAWSYFHDGESSDANVIGWVGRRVGPNTSGLPVPGTEPQSLSPQRSTLPPFTRRNWDKQRTQRSRIPVGIPIGLFSHRKPEAIRLGHLTRWLEWRGSISGNEVRIFLFTTFWNGCGHSTLLSTQATWPLSPHTPAYTHTHTRGARAHTWCFAASGGYFRDRHSV
jgi:hypothetical protein